MSEYLYNDSKKRNKAICYITLTFNEELLRSLPLVVWLVCSLLLLFTKRDFYLSQFGWDVLNPLRAPLNFVASVIYYVESDTQQFHHTWKGVQ